MRVMEAELEARIERALVECADDARSTVLHDHVEGRSPTAEECMEVVKTEPGGQPVTRAMWLGGLMHQLALECLQEELEDFLSGRFSLEPRYWRDPKTRRLEWMSAEDATALLRKGRGAELRGSIAPDVVIHTGSPLQAQRVYDLKFPCVNTDEWALWRIYPRGQSYQGRSQDAVYQELLGITPKRVQPRLGVEP